MSVRKKRYSKEDWLRRSLDILAQEGEQKLTIDYIVGAMGVTKGSFYWHFKNRSDFINSLVDYWAVFHTEKLAQELASIADPSDRLLRLMLILTEQNHSRYDISIMNWGMHEPIARKKMKDMFKYRRRFVRSIFSELGFSGEDLEMRVQTMVFFQSMESSPYTRLTKKQRLEYVELRHKMLTAR